MTTIPVSAALARGGSRRTTAARVVSALAAALVGLSTVPLLRAPWTAVMPAGVTVAHPALVAWHIGLEAAIDCVLVALLIGFAARPEPFRAVMALACAVTSVAVLVNLPAAGPTILITALVFFLPAALAWQAGLSRAALDALGSGRLALVAAAIVAVPGLPYATLCLARQRTSGDDVAQAHAYASTAEHVVVAGLLLLLLSTRLRGTALLAWSLLAAGGYLASAAATCHGPAAPGLGGTAVAAVATLLVGTNLLRDATPKTRQPN